MCRRRNDTSEKNHSERDTLMYSARVIVDVRARKHYASISSSSFCTVAVNLLLESSQQRQKVSVESGQLAFCCSAYRDNRMVKPRTFSKKSTCRLHIQSEFAIHMVLR
ncbi:hypothetical protein F2P81_007251 [Scophthalmus maximus]|uniref:Uncharacterized protein n=1 Tax=Scophthalmus maximus TaxID=52904 RepID=A0A6A4T5U6_SCOMX|nr:hypothetical protein F2P81_007251 [Scophthalmus maximus]